MAVTTYRAQAQEQHQDPGTPAPAPAATAPAGNAAPAALPSFEAELAAFKAEGHKVDPDDSPAVQSGVKVAPAETGDGDEATAEADDSSDEAEDEGEPAAEAKGSESASELIDYAKLVAAVDSDDLPALIEALGPAADKLLTSKAHKTLRIQAKELGKKIAEAEAADKRATALAERLDAKYSDPIAVRKAVETQAPDACDKFIDYAEKTIGAPWNDIMKWVGKNLAGRPERLQVKARAETAATAKQETERQEAVKQTQAWVNAEVTKADATLLSEMPEITDMIIDEIKTGYARGVDHPAKALPLVLKKLEAQHAKLSKIIERKSKGRKAKASTPAPAPAARAGRIPANPKTVERTLAEDIADFMRENNIRK